MLNISKSSKEEIKPFNSMEWMDADTMYYGVPVEWIQTDFVFKAEDEGVIVGSIFGHVEEGVLDIKDIIVARDKRRKGVGKQLMEAAEKFGKDSGAHKSHIIFGVGWPVENFCITQGYIRVGELKNHFLHKDFAVYEKTL